MQILSITSGKGGVGKTNLICNLAFEWAKRGQRVLLIDADMGLANVDIILDLRPKATLEDLFSGKAPLSEILIQARPNLTVLPAASGVQDLTLLSDAQILQLLSALDTFEGAFDVLLLDTGAGIGKNVMFFNAAAMEVMVVATPEPTSMTDAYAVMKVLHQTQGLKRFQLLVNQAQDRKQALKVYRHLTKVADLYLSDVAISFLGFVAWDAAVSASVIQRKLLLEYAPASPAAVAIRQIVDEVQRLAPQGASGNLQLFWRRLLKAGAE
ncbi:MinD/ParA family protein [Myxococcota bacterium]|nr:MinD/ParA family protein [Myxococcota bacterium]MBU1430929.1 MinD/ParA family protein [Myxococcota bacterium]MBU1900716.1 MinD/ParA family protein [Myxococcota bacterium]